ncbi:DUF3164 family protein [Prevotella sp.]|jgi:hypothetical protein|uniref:DUF3164 family protein n=1 Tax=Prevotella sp. TaxID=59823 RepID=UPI00261630FA|nr:DUF3164 family protein [Prevotella sp.]
METKKNPIDLSQMTAEEKKALLAQLNADANESRQAKRDAYEGLRAEFMHRVEEFLVNVTADVKGFKQWLEKESEGFISVMRDYGQLKNADQRNYTITDGDFRLQVASNSVKGFDERADMAAERLVAYLKNYMQKSEKGQEDPMYQLAMTLLERNQRGDLDYKSISKLYELEDRFGDQEYKDIMTLFKESNVVQKTAVNYYFFRRHKETGVWMRIEPSFCRL